ncbi:hypothetical protein AWZ92_18060 [Shigella sonnei]|nr:hypothetical protein AWZ92_18060 [Shigella sonnei]
MLSREDFYMIKQMRQQGAYIVDIATQIGCSERTVRRYLKYPEPPARKTRHKMVKLLFLIHISEPTRLRRILFAVYALKTKAIFYMNISKPYLTDREISLTVSNA